MQIVLDCDDYFQCMMAWDRYSPEITRIMERIVELGDRAVDVGAHVGYVTLILAPLVGAHGHVYSFEPDPRPRAQLLASVAMNSGVPVTVLSEALGDQRRLIPFYLSPTLGWSTAVVGSHLTNLKKIVLQSVPLDALVEEGVIRGPIRLVKIDVEGWEPGVLRGMREMLLRDKPALIVELNRLMLSAAGSGPREVIELVQEFGYEVFVVSEAPALWRRRTLGRVSALSPDVDAHGDIVCVHLDDTRTRATMSALHGRHRWIRLAKCLA